MGGVIVKTRENYKSRRVAAAQRRTLCVRTGLQSRPPRPFLLLFLRITTGIIPDISHKCSRLLLIAGAFAAQRKCREAAAGIAAASSAGDTAESAVGL